MSEKERQLPLDLAAAPAYGVEDFLVSSSNEAAYLFIEQWPDWPDRRALLIGPAGSGKTHLAHLWAAASHAVMISAKDLTEAAVPRLLARRALVVEDADRTEGIDAALFHLLNLAQETASFVLVTARGQPAQWPTRLADLASRLWLLPSVEIDAPDETLLKAVLVKLFVDRQLVVDVGTIDYLALHLDRSFDAARTMVGALDREALSRRRRITRAMAAQMVKAQT